MHEDLIKRLRTVEKLADKGLIIAPSICLEAADAIEELNILADNGEAAYDIMVRQTSYIEELQKKTPRWIPVTERLPEKPENYPHCELRQCFFLVTLISTAVVSCGFDFDNNRWRETIPVTHWMPLPEPPKEET